MRIEIAAFALALLLCACGPTEHVYLDDDGHTEDVPGDTSEAPDLAQGDARACMVPQSLDFGTVNLQQMVNQSLSLYSCGGVSLEVIACEVDEELGLALAVPVALPATLRMGARVEFGVTLKPVATGELSSTIDCTVAGPDGSSWQESASVVAVVTP